MTTQTPAVKELTAEQFRALIEQSSDVITVVDENGRIQYESPNSERVKGWSAEELIGENVLDYVHPDDRDEVLDQCATLQAERGVTDEEIEFRFEHKDGEYIWLSVTGAAPTEEIPVDGYVLTSRDISTRKAYEQQLIEQRDDLETLNEVLRHDIRNDLQLISSYAEMLEDHVDDEGEQFLATIRESAANAVDLTASARDLAEVLLRPDVDCETVALAPILRDQIETIQSTYGHASLAVDGSIPEIDVRGGDLLSAVFRNILKNAIQHNDKETPEITASVALTDDDTAMVRVADNGPGVRDEIKEEIFGKGEKGLESAGTGIGLYLVRTLVEGYGGGVWVEDNDPEGAVFVVELPRAD
ncbi:two-component system sensor histidine kinase NtrB [Halonotius terrestris]|nr:PAS domain-containing sensor histidine kinase [Halonotius terrestris]